MQPGTKRRHTIRPNYIRWKKNPKELDLPEKTSRKSDNILIGFIRNKDAKKTK